MIRAAVPDATDDETDTYARRIQDERHPDNPARYLAGFPAATIAEGIMSIRRSSGGATVFGDMSADARPSSVPYRFLCPRCSRPGHGAGTCPDRAPVPDPAAAERPVALAAVGERCSYERCHSSGPVPAGAEYHEACGHLAEIHARADCEEAARRRALVEAAARPDGGHAA